MAYNGLTVEYAVHVAGEQFFIPGNCQAPNTSHDNPDNGIRAQRVAACQKTAPNGTSVVVS